MRCWDTRTGSDPSSARKSGDTAGIVARLPGSAQTCGCVVACGGWRGEGRTEMVASRKPAPWAGRAGVVKDDPELPPGRPDDRRDDDKDSNDAVRARKRKATATAIFLFICWFFLNCRCKIVVAYFLLGL